VRAAAWERGQVAGWQVEVEPRLGIVMVSGSALGGAVLATTRAGGLIGSAEIEGAEESGKDLLGVVAEFFFRRRCRRR
jgi:hypothetical protein